MHIICSKNNNNVTTSHNIIITTCILIHHDSNMNNKHGPNICGGSAPCRGGGLVLHLTQSPLG